MKAIVIVVASLLASVYGRMMQLERDGRELLEQGKGPYGRDTFCTTPAQKEKVSFPEKFVGRGKIDFDMYSGYVNVTSAPDYLFYWFFGTRDKSDTAPLIIWTNGGPGCTSMEGATTENGPLFLLNIKESCSSTKCDYTGQFSANPYAWNAHANILYLDQPRNVGYSFGYGSQVKSSVEAADDMVTFYVNWLKLFPEFVGRELIIAGESYGGHYVPAWANAILDYNQNAAAGGKINLAGIAIGNGCVNDTVQDTASYVAFQHEQNLIPEGSNPTTMSAANSAMNSYLGYNPNFYDYRLQSITCSGCYSYNYSAWAHWFLQTEVTSALNVCGDAGVDAFSGAAGGCISMGAFDSRDKFDYSGALGRALDAGVLVTLYYGKTDTACNYKGGQVLADTISWGQTSAFKNAQLAPIIVGGAELGQQKSVGGLTFIQIENAGHMVPQDQPAASALAIESIVGLLTNKH